MIANTLMFRISVMSILLSKHKHVTIITIGGIMQQDKPSLHTETKKATALTIISAVVLVLAVAATSLAAYFWQQERYTTDALRERISELESDGVTVSGSGATSAGRLCDANTAQFTAEVGRFTLNLADGNYVIIKNHDGAGEGGDATRISIGKCLDSENNTVEYNTNEEVTIQATPASNWSGTNFNDWATSRATADGGEVQNLENGTVAGIGTREFAIQGLGKTRKTYFEHDDIWYELTTYDASEGSPALATRTAVIEGLRFTE